MTNLSRGRDIPLSELKTLINNKKDSVFYLYLNAYQQEGYAYCIDLLEHLKERPCELGNFSPKLLPLNIFRRFCVTINPKDLINIDYGRVDNIKLRGE